MLLCLFLCLYSLLRYVSLLLKNDNDDDDDDDDSFFFHLFIVFVLLYLSTISANKDEYIV